MPSMESTAPRQLPANYSKPERRLKIVQVWANNLEQAFMEIRAIIDGHPFVSMDTEFPGVIHRSNKHPYLLSASERYGFLKSNVDALHLIQIGLTFAASPTSPPAYAFEFNLRDFNPKIHSHAPDSIRLLEDHGLDFAEHRRSGIDSLAFATLFMSSGLVCSDDSSVTWVTFHSAYDFGYLIKMLIGTDLPRSLLEFLELVRVFFGESVFDLKHMMMDCDSLYGGLDRVAATLKVERMAGRSHQAGSDSLLTWDTFKRMNEVYFGKKGIRKYAGVLYGFEDCEEGLKKMASW